MLRHRNLVLIVVGQALLIAVLLGLRSQRKPKTILPEPIVTSDTTASESATLADALAIAHQGLASMHENLVDYRGRVIKRERIDGKLVEENEMEIKVQCRKHEGDKIVQPMRVYLKFIRPESLAGREVIWAEDKHDGRLIAHDEGLLNLAFAAVDPTSDRAMEGNRYPITEIGMFNLVETLIQRGEHDLKASGVQVAFADQQMIGDRSCRRIRIDLAEPHQRLTFQRAEIFIDVQRNLPLRYAAYGWPSRDDSELPLEEEYTYLDIETNVGLTDADFDPANEEYNFPSFSIKL